MSSPVAEDSTTTFSGKRIAVAFEVSLLKAQVTVASVLTRVVAGFKPHWSGWISSHGPCVRWIREGGDD